MKVNLLVVTGIVFTAVILAVLLPADSADTLNLEEGGGMKLSSPEFAYNTDIPKDFTCEGNDINPPLAIEGIPSDAKTLVLIVEDPDAPGKTWVHWVVFDIPVTGSIGKDTVPGKEGMNDFGRLSYGGPCPPQGTHRYFFKAYALDKVLDLAGGIDKPALEQAMQGHILAQAELVGLYRRAVNR